MFYISGLRTWNLTNRRFSPPMEAARAVKSSSRPFTGRAQSTQACLNRAPEYVIVEDVVCFAHLRVLAPRGVEHNHCVLVPGTLQESGELGLGDWLHVHD